MPHQTGVGFRVGVQQDAMASNEMGETRNNVIKSVSLNACILEVTRRCNMTCAHCLRGNAENLDMDVVLVDLLMSQVNDISQITFSGGEPFLNAKPFTRFAERVRSRSLDYFGWFYVATNGSVFSREACEALEDLQDHAEELDACRVELSNDEWHDEDSIDETLIRWSKERCLFSRRGRLKKEFVISRGRAAFNQLGTRRDPHIEITGYEFDEESGSLSLSDTDLYIAATGDVLVDCDLPFDQMEYYKIGNILEKPLIEILIDGIPDCELISGMSETEKRCLGYK